MGGWGHGVPGGGDACKQVVVALGLCMGYPGARHRGQSLGPSKKGRASFAPAEVKASQETTAGARVMTGLARDGEDSEWWAQGGHPSLATHRKFKEGSARPPVGDIPPPTPQRAPAHPALTLRVTSSRTSSLTPGLGDLCAKHTALLSSAADRCSTSVLLAGLQALRPGLCASCSQLDSLHVAGLRQYC